MKSRKFRFNVSAAFIAVCVSSLTATVAHAGQFCKDSAGNSPECVGTNSPCVCVERSDLSPPIEDTDFSFDITTDPSNPDVTFKTGSGISWRVWSQVSASDTTPANLGDLFIDSTGTSDTYWVEINNPNTGNAGAANVGSMVLDDSDPAWTGSSNIASGSVINGNLNGPLLVVEDDLGNDGHLLLRIVGDANGPITASFVSALGLTIEGAAMGDIEVEVLWGHLSIGDLHANIDITEEFSGGVLTVPGTVHAGAQINVAAMVTHGTPPAMSFNGSGLPAELGFAGTLFLGTGIGSGQVVEIRGKLTKSGWIDLNGQDVDGELRLWGGASGGYPERWNDRWNSPSRECLRRALVGGGYVRGDCSARVG